jgi:hypothetical protein
LVKVTVVPAGTRRCVGAMLATPNDSVGLITPVEAL